MCDNRRCHKNSDAVTGYVSLGLLQCSPNWKTAGFDCKAAATTKQCCKDSIENQEVCTHDTCSHQAHWLPIKFRIQFKVLLLVYKALNGLAPKYIKDLRVLYKHRLHLQSEAKGLLDEPRTRLKFGYRAFSISAPRLWNALPQHLKDSTSCQAFKKCLKTHLFRLAH